MITQIFVLIVALQTLAVVAIAVAYNNWIIKFVLIAYLTVLANAAYFAFDGVKGWPAEEPKDIKGVLTSVVVVNPSSEDRGGIYISLFSTTPKKWYEYVYPRLAPKTYYIEYSNNRASEFEKAKDAMKEGKEVRINGIPPLEGSASGEGAEGEASEDFVDMIGNLIKKLLPKQKDTYKPTVPDVEIVTPGVPPEKGTNE